MDKNTYVITITVTDNQSGRARAAVKQAVGQFLNLGGADGLAYYDLMVDGTVTLAEVVK